ncbi:MAG TPA: hypothetical protein VGI39_45255 [Polyangiaceae bacterium]|jgi:hypothetical protein
MSIGVLAFVPLLQLTAVSSAASPPGSGPDTTYGRIDGDLGVVAGVGVTVGPHDPRGEVDLRFRYLDTAGLFVSYEDGALFGNGAEPLRVLAGGLEIRPLFLGRWLTGREFGSAPFDLLLDSLGVDLGMVFLQPAGGSFGDRPGLQLGLGVEFPILLRASGPWLGLHGGLRWSDAALAGATVVDSADRAAYLSITLSWHQIFGAHAVDLNDRAPR